nr:hypothetical protein [Tanacetum cinerariifolium]
MFPVMCLGHPLSITPLSFECAAFERRDISLATFTVDFGKTKPKKVRKSTDAPIIKEWVSDDKDEEVTQPKIEQKTIKPSIPKIEFIKPKQPEKKARKTVKQVKNPRIGLCLICQKSAKNRTILTQDQKSEEKPNQKAVIQE